VTEIEKAIRSVFSSAPTSGKTGKSHLESAVAGALSGLGLSVDQFDARQFHRPGMPAWRSRDTGEIEPTTKRRIIDVVAYDSNDPAVLVEVESDLDDLQANGGTSRRNGHYDVFSIARSANRTFFDSYKSLERMATAALFWHRMRTTGAYTAPTDAAVLLDSLSSDDLTDHNPSGLPMFLVAGRCRPHDPGILEARLRSLGARLLAIRVGQR
jgi:hypothetical protein